MGWEWGRREGWWSDCTLCLYVWVGHSLDVMGWVEERAGLVGVRVSCCPLSLSLSVHLVPCRVCVGWGGWSVGWVGVWGWVGVGWVVSGLVGWRVVWVGLGWVGLGWADEREGESMAVLSILCLSGCVGRW